MKKAATLAVTVAVAVAVDRTMTVAVAVAVDRTMTVAVATVAIDLLLRQQELSLLSSFDCIKSVTVHVATAHAATRFARTGFLLVQFSERR